MPLHGGLAATKAESCKGKSRAGEREGGWSHAGTLNSKRLIPALTTKVPGSAVRRNNPPSKAMHRFRTQAKWSPSAVRFLRKRKNKNKNHLGEEKQTRRLHLHQRTLEIRLPVFGISELLTRCRGGKNDLWLGPLRERSSVSELFFFFLYYFYFFIFLSADRHGPKHAAPAGHGRPLLPARRPAGPQDSPLQEFHDRGNSDGSPGAQNVSAGRRAAQVRGAGSSVRPAVSQSAGWDGEQMSSALHKVDWLKKLKKNSVRPVDF